MAYFVYRLFAETTDQNHSCSPKDNLVFEYFIHILLCSGIHFDNSSEADLRFADTSAIPVLRDLRQDQFAHDFLNTLLRDAEVGEGL